MKMKKFINEVTISAKKGNVTFETADINTPYVQKIIDEIVLRTGQPRDKVLEQIEAQHDSFKQNIQGPDRMFAVQKQNSIESIIFNMLTPTDADKLDERTFNYMFKAIIAKNKTFLKIEDRLTGKKVKFNVILTPQPAFVKQPDWVKSVTTAAASPEGDVVFNKAFASKLIAYASAKGIKAKGSMYVSNGGTVPDSYAYIEFLILHEIYHIIHADHFQQSRTEGMTGKMQNYLGDYITNYNLVKAGYAQLPIGLFSNDYNFDKFRTMVDMQKAIIEDFKELNKNQQDQMDDQMDDHMDKDHKQTNKQDKGDQQQDGQQQKQDKKQDKKQDSQEDDGQSDDNQDGQSGEDGQDGEQPDDKQDGQGKGQDDKEDGEKSDDNQDGQGKGQDDKEDGEKSDDNQDGQGKGDEESDSDGKDSQSDSESDSQSKSSNSDKQSDKDSKSNSGDEQSLEDSFKNADNEMQDADDGMSQEELEQKIKEAEAEKNSESEKLRQEKLDNLEKERAKRENNLKELEDKIKSARPVDWKKLIKAMIPKEKEVDEESMTRMHRRTVGQLALGADKVSIKAGNIKSSSATQSLLFILDSSGSMSSFIDGISIDLLRLIDKNKSYGIHNMYIIRFDSTYDVYKITLDMKGSKHTYQPLMNPLEILNKGKEPKLKGEPKPIKSLFQMRWGAGTEFPDEIFRIIKELLDQEFNQVIFTDTDIMSSSNLVNLVRACKLGMKKPYSFNVILNNEYSYNRVKEALGGSYKYMSYIGDI